MQPSDLNPIEQAILIVSNGNASALARELGCSAQAIQNYRHGRTVPAELCSDIERLAGKQVTRQMLRPRDWRRIWPELAEAHDAAFAAGDFQQGQLDV